MCAVSMIMDARADDWRRRMKEQMKPFIVPPFTPIVSQQEVDEFRRLLERAREWDRQHGQPDCEMESKREKLRKLADELGVKIDFV